MEKNEWKSHKIGESKSRKFFGLPLIHMQFNGTQDL